MLAADAGAAVSDAGPAVAEVGSQVNTEAVGETTVAAGSEIFPPDDPPPSP